VLRLRLAIVIAVSMMFVVVLAVVLFGGARAVESFVDSGQRAYAAFDRYGALSLNAYRHFKQRMDLLLVDNEATQQDVESSARELREALQRLREAVDMRAPGQDPAAGEAPELRQAKERFRRISGLLDDTMRRFDEVERLRQQGKREAALLLLSDVLEDNIDRGFEPLIDAAMQSEHDHALVAGAELTSLLEWLRAISVVVGLAAVLFGVTASLLLFRAIQGPIKALMHGTDEIAEGRFAHRIPVSGGGELAYLATHFNQMAQKLEHQQHRLHEAQALLEHKVTERTRQLDRVNGELQALDHARVQFLADISHELRTPITVIRGEAEITLRGSRRSTEEYREALERILELSDQLGMLVSDLLFLARAESANLQFDWETVELTDLVMRAVDDMRTLACDKSIELRFDVPAEPVSVRGDAQRLRQVLFVLLDNACRYSNPQTVVEVRLEASPREAAVHVIDEGIGVAAQDLEIIFERYYRSAKARRSNDSGSGLGLPVAKAIVHAHGGRIVATSNAEGAGTTFSFSLPVMHAISELVQLTGPDREDPDGHPAG
jgi:signal transduction histidine kinase